MYFQGKSDKARGKNYQLRSVNNVNYYYIYYYYFYYLWIPNREMNPDRGVSTELKQNTAEV